MRRGIGRLRAGGSFSPIFAFTGGGAGVWLDPSDISTGYQDYAGVTRQTATGQPSGLRLDKRLGLAVTSLTVPTSGWTLAASISQNANVLTFTAAPAAARASHTAVFTVGARSTGSLTVTGTGNISIYLGAGSGGRFDTNVLAGGSQVVNIDRYAEADYLFVDAGSSGFTGTVTINSLSETRGNHVIQSTSLARPEYDVLSGISSDYFDGSDDAYGLSFSAGRLINGMDFFAAIKRAGASDGRAGFVTGAASFFGTWETSASAPDTGAGTVTYLVNGSAVASTRTALKTAMTVGSWVVLEARGLDLSAWTSLNFGFSAGYGSNADVGGVVLCPTQSTGNRDSIRRWLGAKVGLAL